MDYKHGGQSPQKRKVGLRSSYAKRRKTNTRFSSKAVVISRPVRDLSETKTIDTEALTTPANGITSTEYVACLNTMVQGNDIINRTGRRIAMKSIRLLAGINQFQQGAAPADDFVSVALIYDRQTNGGTPSWADVFTSVMQGGGTQSTAWDMINPNNFDRFRILRRGYWKFDVNGSSPANPYPAGVTAPFGTQDTIVNWFVPLKDAEVHYNAANNGNAADIITGALWLMVKGRNNAANTFVNFTYGCRLRFRDL